MPVPGTESSIWTDFSGENSDNEYLDAWRIKDTCCITYKQDTWLRPNAYFLTLNLTVGNRMGTFLELSIRFKEMFKKMIDKEIPFLK